MCDPLVRGTVRRPRGWRERSGGSDRWDPRPGREITLGLASQQRDLAFYPENMSHLRVQSRKTKVTPAAALKMDCAGGGGGGRTG